MHNDGMNSARRTGQAVIRVEGRDKVTGRARYTADNVFDGLVYATVVQSQITSGTVTADSLRESAARAASAPPVFYTC